MYGLLFEDFRVSLKLINNGILELPSVDFPFEQDIELTIGTTLGLWEAEEGPDHNRKANTAPEKSSFTRPRPSSWVEHVRNYDIVDNAKHVVGVPGKDHGLSAKTSGRKFGHQ